MKDLYPYAYDDSNYQDAMSQITDYSWIKYLAFIGVVFMIVFFGCAGSSPAVGGTNTNTPTTNDKPPVTKPPVYVRKLYKPRDVNVYRIDHPTYDLYMDQAMTMMIEGVQHGMDTITINAAVALYDFARTKYAIKINDISTDVDEDSTFTRIEILHKGSLFWVEMNDSIEGIKIKTPGDMIFTPNIDSVQITSQRSTQVTYLFDTTREYPKTFKVMESKVVSN